MISLEVPLKYFVFPIALALVGCQSDGPSSPPEPRLSPEEQVCRNSGLIQGTSDFDRCVSITRIAEGFVGIMETDKNRHTGDRERDTIGDGLATQICDKHARESIRYPIKQKQSSRVSGDYEKTVNIDYSIDRTAENPAIIYSVLQVECKLRGRQLVDYNER